MKLQGSGLFHPKTLQSQNCQPAENRLSLNSLEFVHGQLRIGARVFHLQSYSAAAYSSAFCDDRQSEQ
jgi:hypothetical protein